MNTRSLRFRMTTSYVGLLATALLLFGATVYYRLERHLIGQLKESLVEQARTIAEELLVDAHVKGDQYVITEINESYDPEVTTVRLKVEENQLVDVFGEIGTLIEGLKGA
jgi:sensor histidine kinase regulating citrate/malate metabolism